MLWIGQALLIVLAQTAVGWLALRVWLPSAHAADWWAWTGWSATAFALGSALSGTLLLAVGVVALPPGGVFWLLTAVLAVMGAYGLASWCPRRWPRVRPFEAILLLLVAAEGIVLLWMALVPELEVDAVAYHLTVPRAYLNWGRIRSLPWEPHANWHYLHQMGYLWALALEGGSVVPPKLLEAARCLAAAGGVGALVRIVYRREAALPAAALFLAGREVLRYGPTAHVDAGQTVYTVAAAWLLAQSFLLAGQGRLLLTGAFLLGCPAAVKQTGYVFLIAGLAAVFFAGGREIQWRLTRRNATFATTLVVAAMLPILPWWLKNAVYTGNPFFPFLADWFPAHRSAAIGLAHIQDYYPDQGSLLRRLWPGWDHLYVVITNVRLTRTSGALVLVPLAALLWLYRDRRPGMAKNRPVRLRLYLILAAALVLPILVYTPFSRFLAALFPLAAAVFVGEISLLGSQAPRPRLLRHLIYMAFLAFYIWHGAEFVRHGQYGRKALARPPHLPVLTKSAAAEYRARYQPSSHWIQRLHELVDEDAVLQVSAKLPSLPLLERRFLPTVPVVTRPAVETLASHGYTPQQMARAFQNYGVTHVLTGERFIDPAAAGFRDRYLTQLAGPDAGMTLYRFSASSSSSRGSPRIAPNDATDHALRRHAPPP